MEHQKLYCLSYIGNEDCFAKILSHSHSIEKLMGSVPAKSWTMGNDPNCKYTKATAKLTENETPLYIIREVNFIV